MKQMGHHPQLANLAFYKFHEIFGEKILAVSRRFCSHSALTNNVESVEDLCQEILIRFYLGINGFDENKYPDEKSLIRGVMAWVSKIASWIYPDMIKEIKESVDSNSAATLEIQGYKEWLSKDFKNYPEITQYATVRVYDENNILIKECKIKKDDFLKILDSLTEKERDILMTYMRYYPELPPRSEIHTLSRIFKIKINSVRGTKGRVFKKVEKKILDITKIKEYSR
jgi:DNA-directed RNA polymerase specialized sigma24 family protein